MGGFIRGLQPETEVKHIRMFPSFSRSSVGECVAVLRLFKRSARRTHYAHAAGAPWSYFKWRAPSQSTQFREEPTTLRRVCRDIRLPRLSRSGLRTRCFITILGFIYLFIYLFIWIWPSRSIVKNKTHPHIVNIEKNVCTRTVHVSSHHNVHDCSSQHYFQEGADYWQNEFSHCAEPCQNFLSSAAETYL